MKAFQKSLFVCLIIGLCSFSFAGSLVGHWKLDETSGTTAYDSAGTNNGTVSGALWTAGKIDGGLDFDGIDDKVIIPDSDVLTPANTMTLSFWVYNSGGQDAGVYKWASCPSEPASPGWSRSYYLLVSAAGKVNFQVLSSVSTADILVSTSTVSLNQWHLITATFASGTAKIYIDGVLDSSKTMTVTSIMNDAQPLTFGGAWDYCGTDEWFARLDGMFDDIRLYNYALDANEVAALYVPTPQTGLIAHWKLDETSGTTAYDSAGTNNGTVSGALWTAGTIDGGLDFDGIDDKVIIPDSDVLTPVNTMTLSFWAINRNGKNTGVYKIAGCAGEPASPGDSRAYQLRIAGSSGKVSFGVHTNTGTSNYLESLNAVSANQWHLITATFNSGAAKLYIDGVLDNSMTMAFTTIMNDVQPLIIGGMWYYCGTDSFDATDGVIDDVRLYDYALSDAEVAALYVPTPQTGLIAHWKLDETSGDVAYDSAGTNNGTVSGALWTTGRIGQALNFDGINDYVMVPDNDALDITGDITIAAWVSFAKGGNEQSRSEQVIVSKSLGNGATYNPFDFRTSIDIVPQLAFVRANSSTHQFVYSDQPIPLYSWHHVVVTVKNGIANFYVDGIVTDKFHDDLFQSAAGNSRPLYIGRRDDGLYLKGLIDDVRLYDYALSDAEVSALYGQAPPLPHVATTYHVATTGLDTNAGTTQATAFATIQKGIDTAVDGDIVVVWPGTYDQQANFSGKAITVKSADAEPAVISNSSDYAFVFENAEEANSVLQNFVIAKGCFAVYVSNSSPTIKNLTIVDNYFGIDAYDGATPAVSNCIFLNNRFGDIEGADTQYSWPFDRTAVACWSFEETTGTKVYDGIGNNDGTITGATREPNGLLGRAMSFDGNGDYITVPNSASLNITGDITMAAWVKPTSFSTNIRCIAIKPYAYELIIKNTNPLFRLSGSGGIRDNYLMIEKTFTDLVFTLNQWNYIVVKREGSLVKAWLNGKESIQTANISATSLIATSSYPFSIGTVITSSPLPYYFVGKIDEVALFNRALSTEEIENYYKNMLAGYDYTDPMMVDSDGGDYHLFSEYGRYDLATNSWVLDDATSPCVDAGDPTDSPMGEPMPNGGRINIGAYGGIGHASKGGEWPLPFDFNTDGIVNMADFAKLAEHWLEKLPWVE